MNSPLPPKLNIRIHSAAKKDFLKLNNSELEEISYALINRLSYGDIRGTRLENHPEIGDLSECFKLYFDLARGQSPRYRIVYKYLPSINKPSSIFIVAVGDRNKFKVYRDAIERLHHLKEDDADKPVKH
jgi:mRNA-degrading endonuclease RelE of RelBE toxin-antitoxin system